MNIPDNAEVFAVDADQQSRVILNGDIVHDHDGQPFKFLRVVRGAAVADCKVVAKHTQTGKQVETTPAALNIRILWEVEP